MYRITLLHYTSIKEKWYIHPLKPVHKHTYKWRKWQLRGFKGAYKFSRFVSSVFPLLFRILHRSHTLLKRGFNNTTPEWNKVMRQKKETFCKTPTRRLCCLYTRTTKLHRREMQKYINCCQRTTLISFQLLRCSQYPNGRWYQLADISVFWGRIYQWDAMITIVLVHKTHSCKRAETHA